MKRVSIGSFAAMILVELFVGRMDLRGMASLECRVAISAPQFDDKEGADVLVSGPATVPPDGFLWVFARRQGLELVWPQGGNHARIDRGEYRVLATLGEPRDKGKRFDLIVQIVDSVENAKLEAWFKTADETGRYPGIRLPPFLSGCGAPATVTVVKTD
jgi:hypothetical protein